MQERGLFESDDEAAQVALWVCVAHFRVCVRRCVWLTMLATQPLVLRCLHHNTICQAARFAVSSLQVAAAKSQLYRREEQQVRAARRCGDFACVVAALLCLLAAVALSILRFSFRCFVAAPLSDLWRTCERSAALDREVAVRRKIEREWNKREEDFASLDEYNDYLEEREDIVYNLVNGIDVEATQERVAANRSANAELIARNAAKREAEEKLELEQIRIEEERWLLRRAQFLRQDQRERLVKLRAEAEFLAVERNCFFFFFEGIFGFIDLFDFLL